MTDAEIRNYLDGFIAWDVGCTDAGIKDDAKREMVRQHLVDLAGEGDTSFRDLVHPFVFHYASFEDIQENLDWLREFLGFDDWSGM